jgi:VanZ like protein
MFAASGPARAPRRVVNRRRLTVAIAAGIALIASSPFVGDLRAAMLIGFRGQFQLMVGGTIAIAVLAAVVVALVRIRDRRTWRFTGIAVAIAGAVLYAQLVSTGNLLVDVVEHVHFIEYGLLAWLFYSAWRCVDNGAAVIWPLLAGTVVGIADESVQAFIPGRVGEAHDIFLNVVAVACGLCFAVSVDPPRQLGVPLLRPVIRPIAYGVVAVLVSFATFFQAVHLGHDVYEPDMGVFWSHYDGPTLKALGIDRSVRWRSGPPVVLKRLSREDEYLSEALWHVQERNRAWGAGDVFTAWRENLILERYFAPALDVPSFAAPVPPRWPRQQHDETAARVGTDPGIYISRAAPYPIYTWPPLAFWSVVATIVAAIISAC